MLLGEVLELVNGKLFERGKRLPDLMLADEVAQVPAQAIVLDSSSNFYFYVFQGRLVLGVLDVESFFLRCQQRSHNLSHLHWHLASLLLATLPSSPASATAHLPRSRMGLFS